MKASIKTQFAIVVAILVAIGIIISGIGWYAMYTIKQSADEIDTSARRLTGIEEANVLMLDTATNIREIVLTTNEQKQRELQAHVANLVASADAKVQEVAKVTRLKQEWDELTATWEAHKTVANRIIDLTLQNTNVKANRLVSAECNPLRKEEERLFRTVFNGTGIQDISTLMLGVPTAVREIALSRDVDQMRAIQKELLDDVQEVDRLLKVASKEATSKPEWKTLLDLWERHKVVATNIINLSLQNTNGQASVLISTECNPLREKETVIFNDIVAKQQGFFSAASEAAESAYKTISIMLIVVPTVGLLAGIIMAWFVITRLSRSLAQVITDLSENSTSVENTASQMAVTSSSLSEGSTEQAASLEETSSALEQMASMTRQNADNATRTTDTTKNTVTLVNEGGDVVKSVSTAMSEISDSAEQIGQIIATIQEIAFQTNLLALNAAVEAARAGEAGKGFAVVADEVRNLAQRSAQAAKDTSELIEGTVQRVRAGSEYVAKLTDAFVKIEGGTQEVGKLITNIASATHEQAQGVDQVNTAVAQMDKVTQQNAANAEEAAGASTNLLEDAAKLNEVVLRLVSMVNGGSAPANGAERYNGESTARKSGGGRKRMLALPPPRR